MNYYDIIIIGGGPGGYNSATVASKAGLKVALIENDKLGGTCLNAGCIPSKTLLYSSKIFDIVKNASGYGVQSENVNFLPSKVLQRKNKVIRRLNLGIAHSLKTAGVTLINGHGKLNGKDGDRFIVSVDDDIYYANNIILATGSSAMLPPIQGLATGMESGMVLTNNEILSLTDIPEQLVVVGAGAVGLEMALHYATVGSKVSVVEFLPSIAKGLEVEISEVLLKSMQKRGITFYLGAKATAINHDSVTIVQDEKTMDLACDKVLIATGRVPNTQGLGLESVGVEINRSAVHTDQNMATNIKGVYAIGDINGKSMLAHTAYREGEVAINNILGIKDSINYGSIPAVIYTQPEVAWVGESQDSATNKGMDIKVAKLPFTYSGRYVAEAGDMDGVIKIIVDKSTNTLIGVHMLGSYASEFIIQAVTLIDLGVDIERIKKIVYPHPTVCEILRDAINALE